MDLRVVNLEPARGDRGGDRGEKARAIGGDDAETRPRGPVAGDDAQLGDLGVARGDEGRADAGAPEPRARRARRSRRANWREDSARACWP